MGRKYLPPPKPQADNELPESGCVACGRAHRETRQALTASARPGHKLWLCESCASAEGGRQHFLAAYLAARIFGLQPADAARAGHRLAGAVIMSPGAVIAREVMPKDIISIGASA